MATIQQLQQSFPAAEITEKPHHNAHATEQNSQPATPQPTYDDKRWRLDDVRQFDGTGDVYTFTDRVASITELKGLRLIQNNLVTILKGVAFNWYHYELTNVVKWALKTSESIDPRCQTLNERFRPTQLDLMSQLEATRYTRKDAANEKDTMAYIRALSKALIGINLTPLWLHFIISNQACSEI